MKELLISCKKKMKSFTILISYASDVVKELESIERVVKRFNDLFSTFLNISFNTNRWDRNAYPTNLCDYPQGGVNEQLVKKCDLCVAIFKTRLGTPRGGKDKNGVKYQSGTEEEIALMTEKRKPVFIYFLDEECINLKGLDITQYNKLKKFKTSCGEKYIYSIYNDKDDTYKYESDLEFKFFNHLCNYFIKDRKFIEPNINDDLYLNLIGGFSNENTYDIEILKYLTQSSDDQIKLMTERILNDVRAKNVKSSFEVSSNCISVLNRLDFWQINGSNYNDKGLFEKFKFIAQQVLSEPTNYSKSLVKGLNETLALIKNYSDVFTNLQESNNIKIIADDVVCSLFFEYGNSDKSKDALERFYDLQRVDKILSILAEASPENFLRAIDSAIESVDFKYHIRLLWALERLAWDSRYTVYVFTFASVLSTFNNSDIDNVLLEFKVLFSI